MKGNKLLRSLFILGLNISQESPASALPSCGALSISQTVPTVSYVPRSVFSFDTGSIQAGAPIFYAVVTGTGRAGVTYNFEVLRSIDGFADSTPCSESTTPSYRPLGTVQ
jgi:hypothetical protein